VNRKRLVVGIAVVGTLLMAGAAWSLVGSRPPEVRGAWVAARAMKIPSSLTELGEVISERVDVVGAGTGGEVIWLIDEGTKVEPGRVVARFNGEDIEDALANEEREVAAATQALEREVENERSKTREMELATRKAELEVTSAELAFEALLKESTEEQIKKGEVALERARFEAREAEKDVERVQRLLRAGVATEQELTAAREALKTRSIEERKAAATLKTVKEGPDPRLVDEAKLKIRQANQQLARQRAIEQETRSAYANRVKVARANLVKAMSQLAYQRSELAGCTVKTRVPGRVVFHRVWKGDDNRSRIEVGEAVNRNTEILKIADLENLRVRFPINEVDLVRVKKGMRAEVRLLGIPDETFPGELVHIGKVAWDKNKRLGELALVQSGEASVSVVEAEVVLQRRDPRVRLGFTAIVRVTLEPLDAAVAVPARAVFLTSSGPAVRVRGNAAPRRVVLGEGSSDWVEVKSGLSVGEDVLVRG